MEKRATNRNREFWVGLLFLSVLGLIVVFGWLMGAIGPMHRQEKFFLLFNFAGGVEVGSPVRVSGVKVGKVERIEFLPENAQEANGVVNQEQAEGKQERVALKITIDVSKAATLSIRKDSRFFVNMAGIIGERYIEISPGTAQSPVLVPGSVVRGVDPPRIDQLLSQGYGVFGKVEDFLEANEQTISDFLTEMREFMLDANKILKSRDRQKLGSLLENLNAVASDAHEITQKLKNPEVQRFYDQILEIVGRAHRIDPPTLKKFLQEDGIRARIF